MTDVVGDGATPPPVQPDAPLENQFTELEYLLEQQETVVPAQLPNAELTTGAVAGDNPFYNGYADTNAVLPPMSVVDTPTYNNNLNRENR